MKKFLSLNFLALLAIGCNNQPQPIQKTQSTANTNLSGIKQNDSETVSSHSFNTAK